jgi:hypothetical protein
VVWSFGDWWSKAVAVFGFEQGMGGLVVLLLLERFGVYYCFHTLAWLLFCCLDYHSLNRNCFVLILQPLLFSLPCELDHNSQRNSLTIFSISISQAPRADKFELGEHFCNNLWKWTSVPRIKDSMPGANFETLVLQCTTLFWIKCCLA